MYVDTSLETLAAPSVTTAAQLDMTEEELATLLKVRNLLADGILVHDACRKYEVPAGFDMSTWIDVGCGTVRCIGGWMDHFMKNGESVYLETHCNDRDHIYYLFCPLLETVSFFKCTEIWKKITPEQAVRAIDNFTTHSPRDARWAEILG